MNERGKYHPNTPCYVRNKATTSISVEERAINDVLRLGYSISDAFACGVRILNDRGPHSGRRFRQKRATLQLHAISVWDEAEYMERLQNNGYTFTEAWYTGAEALTRAGIHKKTIVSDQARQLLEEIKKQRAVKA